MCSCSSSNDDEDAPVFGVTFTTPGVIQGGDTDVPWTINGNGFDMASTVTIDDPTVTISNLTFVSDTQITFDLTAPNTVLAGTAMFTVTNMNLVEATSNVPTIPEVVSLTTDIQPILDASCTSCHSGGAPSGGLVLTAGATHAATVGVTSAQVGALQLVNAGNPDASYLVDKIEGTQTFGSQMPPTGAPLTPLQRWLVRGWISGGALDN
ncbi:MAG: hypothetical protein AAGA20_00935 [Planctomycetota bacterium]